MKNILQFPDYQKKTSKTIIRIIKCMLKETASKTLKKKTENQIRLQNKTKIICQVNICKHNNFPLRVIKLNPTIQGYKIQLYILYKETCLNPSDLQGLTVKEWMRSRKKCKSKESNCHDVNVRKSIKF